MQNNEISIIHTPCKNCAFAIYDNKTQTGCHLDYINKYKNIGAEVLEAYDNDLDFFIINNKKCIGYRENSWFIKNGLSADSSIEDKITKFNSLNQINYLLVINFMELGDSQESVDYIQESLCNLTIHPKKIIFIRPSEGSESTIYASLQKLMIKSGINCAWRIQTMVDDSISNENILHNAVNHDKSYRFICYIKNNRCVSNLNKVVVHANDIVYKDLKQFGVLTDADYSCILFSAGVYRFSLIEHQVDILSDYKTFEIV